MSAQVEKLSYTIPEAATALGIGRTSLYELISARRITPFKLCGRTLIPREELERLVSEARAA